MEIALKSVFDLSLSASLIMILFWIIRIALKKAPKIFTEVLWLVMAIRLICPLSLKLYLGIVKSSVEPVADTTISKLESTGVLTGLTKISNIEEIGHNNHIFTTIWLIGMFLVLAYGIASYIFIKKKTEISVRLEGEDNIYICDDIDTPFILGFISPRIYMPSNLDKETIKNVILHEKMHLKKYDNYKKLFAYLILALHFFNPIVWISYILFVRDLELACDEAVVREMSLKDKKSYASSLLTCTAIKRTFFVYPVAFAELGVATRIKEVFKTKKMTVGLGVGVTLIAAILLILNFTNISMTDNNNDLEKYRTEYIGDASKTSAITYKQTYPEGFLLDYIELQTENKPYELIVYMKGIPADESSFDKLYENAKQSFNLISNMDALTYKAGEDKIIKAYYRDADGSIKERNH